jgi:preprotein translocase subunit Sec61beta
MTNMADIEAEKTNGKKIKIDLDPKEWIIIGIIIILITYIVN